ncbi:LexA family transcriptional regulator [Vibrio fluvialis]|jgi:SOS-response transcriptional repressor LexA|uniref:LexA family protein n=1 Tax=Vibrio fluvialis TaxID=676 RepID=UPI0023801AD6|nr:LexA family transcriptional regulator [Vibrio fluvialis]EKO3419725.1 LexA family transcriptional regulator [Vibrio fluvialis]EKO3529468.1 LexA family transcriptional regulator [Vibrio fluvialis]WDY55201.1 LexA family transcriptional regulator [Vibrio fluvialis]
MDKKTEVGLRLKQLRAKKGVSQKDLADLCGWGPSRISNYESGLRSISLDDAEVLAKHLGLKPYQILFDEKQLAEISNVSSIDIQPTFKNDFPVLSSVQAGAWTEACEPYLKEEISEWYCTTERTSEHCFWLRVQGDSMTSPNGISFPEGTLVLVDTQREAENGSLVVAKLTEVNEATFKKLVIDAGQKYLKPLNASYPPLPINGNCKIIGVVVDAKMKLF